MTKNKTSSFKKGSRCAICTGCGKCFGSKKINTVSSFYKDTSLHKRIDSEDSGNGDSSLIAVDIGTTTIAMQLRSMLDAAVLDTYTCINPQIKYGGDVLSRIEAAEDEGCRKAMQEDVLAVLANGISQFRNNPIPCSGMAIAANTTMIHLLMGLKVSGLGRYPFEPETLEEIHTVIHGIEAVILPGASAFIGADIVAGIHALSMNESKEISLLIDLGTNGEIVLGSQSRLVAAGTAAGTAFEGAEDYYGSDLMLLTSELLKEGILDKTGLLAEPYFKEGVTIGGVHLSQKYIRQLQMAKSAIYTGIGILCEHYGLRDFSEIDKVYLAGGMGYYLDTEAAGTIGLISEALCHRAVAVGNAALEGAFIYGCKVFGNAEGVGNREIIESSDKVVADNISIEVFNLAQEPSFAEAYIENMTF